MLSQKSWIKRENRNFVPAQLCHSFRQALFKNAAQVRRMADKAVANSLALHIPAPPARPGDAPDFSHLRIPPAGIVPRPESCAPINGLRDLAYQLIRVLDDEGQALGDWAPQIAPERLRDGLRAMVLTRLFEERMFRSHRQGKTSFFMKSTGEEAIGAAQSMVLGPRDMCFPTYRVLSWLMARDYPLIDLVNQIFSNARDPLK